MKKPLRSLALALLLLNTGHAAESPLVIFDKFWSTASDNIHPKSLAETHFTPERYKQLRQRAKNTTDVHELTPIFNEFLSSLNVSHSRFYDDESVDFYFFRSLFDTRDPATPVVNHIGAQFIQLDTRYVVREVLSGYPAERAGVRRGDVIVAAGDGPFHPFRTFNPSGIRAQLTVERNGTRTQKLITAVAENPNLSLQKAITNSVRNFEREGRNIGYVRLWSGTGSEHLESFRSAIEKDLIDSDAIVLDLRGGFGGAWYEYLDPFFEDRSSYFSFAVENREGVQSFDADPVDAHIYYAGPMVVLINEGTRSGKEGLAYQFKTSGRATLVGTTTAGAFSAGRGMFNDSELPYFLLIAAAEYTLDGTKVEGVGISPDVEVSYPLDKGLASDPQLEAALDLAADM